MATPDRLIDCPSAWHHVINHGRRRARIFDDNEDTLLFLATLTEAVERFGLEVHAYSLMPNHCQLLVRTARGTAERRPIRLEDGEEVQAYLLSAAQVRGRARMRPVMLRSV